MLSDGKHLPQSDSSMDCCPNQWETRNPRNVQGEDWETECDVRTRGWDSLVDSADPFRWRCSPATATFFLSSFNLNSRSLAWVGPNPSSGLPDRGEKKHWMLVEQRLRLLYFVAKLKCPTSRYSIRFVSCPFPVCRPFSLASLHRISFSVHPIVVRRSIDEISICINKRMSMVKRISSKIPFDEGHQVVLFLGDTVVMLSMIVTFFFHLDEFFSRFSKRRRWRNGSSGACSNKVDLLGWFTITIHFWLE